MLAAILPALLAAAPSFLLRMLGAYQGTVSDAAKTEMNRRDAERDERLKAGDVVIAGMQHRLFWIPWLMCAVPTAVWYGWGVADSIANGALPDVAALPPQLKQYADIIMGNIFYVGGGVAGAQIIAGAIARRK